MKIQIISVHFHDGTHVVGTIRASISTDGGGGAAKVDEIEATPVGIIVKAGRETSLVPWASVKSCPKVTLAEDKPAKAAK